MNIMMTAQRLITRHCYTTRMFFYDGKQRNHAYGSSTWLVKRVNVSVNADTVGIPSQDYWNEALSTYQLIISFAYAVDLMIYSKFTLVIANQRRTCYLFSQSGENQDQFLRFVIGCMFSRGFHRRHVYALR